MTKRAGKPLSWTQRNALGLLRAPRRFLACDGWSWRITGAGAGSTPLLEATAEILVAEGAVEPSAHIGRRWFALTDLGRQAWKDGTWPE